VEIEAVVVQAVPEQALELRADLGELGEDQHAVALGHDLFEHLLQALELVGSFRGEGAAVLKKLRG